MKDGTGFWALLKGGKPLARDVKPAGLGLASAVVVAEGLNQSGRSKNGRFSNGVTLDLHCDSQRLSLGAESQTVSLAHRAGQVRVFLS